ncbi:MAG: hypothetical protein R2824_02260 [Saprospiraceae bacterium]|nr:hypothetical protein [Lewinella sp.]
MQRPFDKLVEALGQPKPPTVVWQEPFDYIRGHCERLCDQRRHLQNVDLYDYLLDYRYMEVQQDLLRYLLPKVLYAWGQYLLGKTEEYGGMSEQVFASLAGRPLYPDFFKEEEFEATMQYVASLILEAMQQETTLHHRGYSHLPYNWFYALGSFMVVFPNLDYLWERWWSLPNEALSLSMVEYVSCLMYENTDNPVFAMWTDQDGGGPPSLVETDGLIYNEATHPDNVAFLESILNIDYIHDRLLAARNVISTPDNLQVLDQMLEDFELQSIILEERLEDFPKLLRLPKQDIEYWW